MLRPISPGFWFAMTVLTHPTGRHVPNKTKG